MIKFLKDSKERQPLFTLLLLALFLRIIMVAVVGCCNLSQSSLNDYISNNFIESSIFAILSLFIVAFSYRIIDLLSSKQVAWHVAAVISFITLHPRFSVMPEEAFLTFPFFLYASLLILRQETLRLADIKYQLHSSSFIIAGFFYTISCLWFPMLFAVLPILIIFLFRIPKKALLIIVGSILFFVLYYTLRFVIYKYII